MSPKFPKLPDKSFFEGWQEWIPMDLRSGLEDFLGQMNWKHWAGAAVVFVFVCAAGLCILLGTSTHAPIPSDIPIYVKVQEGMSAKEVGEDLAAKGIIDSKYKFWFTAKLNGYDNQFKSGSYAFHAGMDIREVIEKLVAGETTVIKFTIPEGFGVKDIAERLSAEGLVDEKAFLQAAKDFAPYDYMEKNEQARYRAEGFLFPDTYTIQADLSEKEIMELMAQDFDTRLTEKLRHRAQELDISIYDLVILASLVEKEARYDEDRPIIAQVFFKRLAIDMPLQTDATLQYLMNEPKEDVSIADTKIDSPYNTYQHRGLPPGPIANPGMAAIEAVLYPADTEYLFFVADREGHNYYSYDYDEHLRIVDEVR